MTFQELVELVTGLNIQSVLFFLFAIWWHTRNLHKELHDVVQEVRSSNLRLARLEGAVYGKDFFNPDKKP
ncbi:MAG: hypothetical protein ACHQ1H_04065 [Nitrososphaerales archaeon]